MEGHRENDIETGNYLPSPALTNLPMIGVSTIISPAITRQHYSHRISYVPVERPTPSLKCDWEDILIIMGLVIVQLANASYMVFLAPVLSQGLNPLFLVCFGSLATGIFTFPVAVLFERRKWPARLKPMMMLKFILLALGGVTSFQALMTVGIKKTSPAIASAMPNLAPGIIFIIAALLRLEKVDIKCIYTQAKILGTMCCLGGAIAISFLQTPSSMQNTPNHLLKDLHHDWVVGCLCLLGAILIVSCNTVLQAATMIDFPAPFTLCSLTSVIGAGFTAILQVMIEGQIDMGSSSINPGFVIGLVLLGSVVSSICVAFSTWAVKKKGPVMVSMFNPTSTVGSIVFSAIYLHQIIKIGSIFGMVLLFCGLYIVLWAKKKENVAPFLTEESTRSHDLENPLLA